MGARLLVMVTIAMETIRHEINLAKKEIATWAPGSSVGEQFNREIVPISISSAALLLLLPIVTSWILNILLHARLNTDFFKLSTKSKLVHLLSTTWITLPVRRLGE